MDSAGFGFWRTVWGNVLAGLAVLVIAAAASWALGFHHQAWRLLTFPVPIPAGVLALIGCLALWAAVRNYPFKRKLSPQRGPLSQDEKSVIHALAAASGSNLTSRQLAAAAGINRILVQQALVELRKRKLVGHARTRSHRVVYGFTTAGREFVIAQGYVKQGRTKKGQPAAPTGSPGMLP